MFKTWKQNKNIKKKWSNACKLVQTINSSGTAIYTWDMAHSPQSSSKHCKNVPTSDCAVSVSLLPCISMAAVLSTPSTLQHPLAGAYHIFLITTQYLSINRSVGSAEDRVWMASFCCILHCRHTYLIIVKDNVWHLIHTGDACCPDYPASSVVLWTHALNAILQLPYILPVFNVNKKHDLPL